ncbi:hypothetical protein TSHO111613_17350 [Tsukamurella hominis]
MQHGMAAGALVEIIEVLGDHRQVDASQPLELGKGPVRSIRCSFGDCLL